MLRIVEDVDVRIRRGTYVVLTVSGAAYTIHADKNVAGLVTASGGSTDLNEEQLVLDECIIRPNHAMFFLRNGQLHFGSRAVEHIYQVDLDQDVDEIAELTARHRAHCEQRRREHNRREAPPVIFGSRH